MRNRERVWCYRKHQIDEMFTLIVWNDADLIAASVVVLILDYQSFMSPLYFLNFEIFILT